MGVVPPAEAASLLVNPMQGSYPVRAPLQETKAPSIAASPFQASVSKEATVPPQLNQTKGSYLQLMKSQQSSPMPNMMVDPRFYFLTLSLQTYYRQ
jgi:hypothetical protein